jgi:uncharacterized cupredoxin-like copper-binding protein
MYKPSRHMSLIFSLLLVAVLGLSACSGTSVASSPSSGAASTPASKAVSGNAVDVTITLTEFKIESSMTDFKVGVPYHFIITNKGNYPHEFRIMPPASGSITPDQAQATTLAMVGKSDLPAGATATLDYTFTQPAPAGTLEFSCHLPGHYDKGMLLAITVEGQ